MDTRHLEQVTIEEGLPVEGDTSLEVMSQGEQGDQEVKGLTESPQGVGVKGIFCERSSFEHALRIARMLNQSNMTPAAYKGNIPDIMIALEISQRLRISPFMVMQNLHVIQGKPSWSSTFIIAVINSSERFSAFDFEMSGEGDDYGCTATAVEISTGKKLKGSKVTIAMARAEGWYTRSGSKWKNMSEQMLKYRAAAFFARIYAPEILMGMHTVDEVKDMKALATEEEKEQAALKAQEGYKVVKTV